MPNINERIVAADGPLITETFPAFSKSAKIVTEPGTGSVTIEIWNGAEAGPFADDALWLLSSTIVAGDEVAQDLSIANLKFRITAVGDAAFSLRYKP